MPKTSGTYIYDRYWHAGNRPCSLTESESLVIRESVGVVPIPTRMSERSDCNDGTASTPLSKRMCK